MRKFILVLAVLFSCFALSAKVWIGLGKEGIYVVDELLDYSSTATVAIRIKPQYDSDFEYLYLLYKDMQREPYKDKIIENLRFNTSYLKYSAEYTLNREEVNWEKWDSLDVLVITYTLISR